MGVDASIHILSLDAEAGRFNPFAAAFRASAWPRRPFSIFEFKPAGKAAGGRDIDGFPFCRYGLDDVGDVTVNRFFAHAEGL